MHFTQVNKSGFSIAAVMIALVMSGFLAVGISQLLTGAAKGQKSVEQKVNYTATINALNTFLSSTANCSLILNSGTSIPSARGGTVAIPRIPYNQSVADSIIAVDNNKFRSAGFRISSMTLTDFQNTADPLFKRARIDIVGEKLGEAGPGGSGLRTSIPINIQVNGSGGFDGCTSDEKNIAQVCRELGFTWSAGSCQAPAPSASDLCTRLGVGWLMVAGTCTSPAAGPSASFNWSNGGGLQGQKNIASASRSGGRLVVRFTNPRPNSNYTVVCNGTMGGMGSELQIFAYSKTTTQFTLSAAHGGGADPIGAAQCVVYDQ